MFAARGIVPARQTAREQPIVPVKPIVPGTANAGKARVTATDPATARLAAWKRPGGDSSRPSAAARSDARVKIARPSRPSGNATSNPAARIVPPGESPAHQLV